MPRIHTHNHRRLSLSIRRPLLALFTAMLLAGCGGKSSPPSATELALVDQLIAQLHLEQSQRAELERQLEFNANLQRVEAVIFVLLGTALAVCLVVLYKQRNTNAP